MNKTEVIVRPPNWFDKPSITVITKNGSYTKNLNNETTIEIPKTQTK